MNDYAALLTKAQAGAADERADRTPPPIISIIEALLFAGNRPLSAGGAAEIIRDLTSEQFEQMVGELRERYRRQRRPYSIQKRVDGYRMTLNPIYRPLRAKLTGGPRETRLSPTALDVLAIIAYRQPIAISEINALKGHDTGSSIRQLLRLNLISLQGKLPQGETAYGTTPRFLEVFNIQSLDDLPQSTDLQKI